MKTFIAIGCALLVGSIETSARLFETRSQCETRYGSVSSTNDLGSAGQQYIYYSNGFMIGVVYDGDTAIALAFAKDGGGSFSDNERDTLMVANANASEWLPFTETPAQTMWKRNDAAAFAIFTADRRKLFFYSQRYIDKSSAAEGESLNRF